jgi:hypothetical protein
VLLRIAECKYHAMFAISRNKRRFMFLWTPFHIYSANIYHVSLI